MTFSDAMAQLVHVRLAAGCSDAEDVVEAVKKLVIHNAILTGAVSDAARIFDDERMPQIAEVFRAIAKGRGTISLPGGAKEKP